MVQVSTSTRKVEPLRVVYLPPSVPSISYRAWAQTLRGFTPLRWYCERLVRRYGNGSLVIACHDDADRTQALPIADEYEVLVAVCQGNALLQALGDMARIAGERPILYFHVESMFGPASLPDRVLEHHLRTGNHFTHAADIPELLGPEIVAADMARAMSALSFTGRVPRPREIAGRLSGAKAAPYRAGPDFGPPPCDHLSRFAAPADVDRARQAVDGLPSDHTWEAIERWKTAEYVPEPLLLSARTGAVDGKRILYVSAGAFYSGAEECLRGLVEQLARTDFEQVAVVGVESVFAERLRAAGCEVAAANCNLLTSARSLVEPVFDKVRPSIVHANGTIGDGFLEVARERSVPVVLHVRTAVFRDTTRLHAADHLIAVSAFARQQLIAAGIRADKISLVYEGVDVERFAPGCLEKHACRSQFGIPRNAFLVLMIARPTPTKRHDLMIEAMGQLRASGVDAYLAFVGDFGDAAFFHEMHIKAHGMQLQEHIKWLPFQHDIRAIECAADVVALPSDGEAFGMCTLEAMALEVPAIVSDSGGGRELVEHMISGLVMRGGDAGSLAGALQLLARDPGLRRQLGRHGRRRACELFSLQRHAERMAEILLGRRPAS